MKNTRSKIISITTILVLMVSILTGGISYDMPAAVCSASEITGASQEKESSPEEFLRLSEVQPDDTIGSLKIYKADEFVEDNSIDNKSAEDFISEVSDSAESGDLKRDTIIARDWNVYSSRYFYQQLGQNEKNLYRAMYLYCMYFLTTEDGNAGSPANYANQHFTINGKTYSESLSRGFSFTNYGVTYAQASYVSLIFLYENPQFYFVDASVVALNNKFYLVFYDLFGNSSIRANYTNTVFNKIDEDAAAAAAATDTVSKLQIIQNRICDWATYNWSIGNMGYGEYYDQSIYSYAVMKNCVCAGYSKSTLAICRKAGIHAIAVTSSNHAWNMVQVGNNWYNLDVTWNDQIRNSAMPYGKYFLVSDTNLAADDKQGEHVPNSNWALLGKPVCASNYVNASSLQTSASTQHAEIDVSADFAVTYIPDLVITLSKPCVSFTGGYVGPTYTVSGGGITFDSTQYYLEYPSSASAIGEYKIYCELKESSGYSGCAEVTYKIVPPKTKIKNIKPSTKGFTVNLKKVSKQTTGYEIQYSLKKDFSKSKTVKLTSFKKTSKKVSGLKSKKKYYVRVRTYKKTSDGKFCSDWSKVMTVKTK